MQTTDPDRLEAAVAAVCADIALKMAEDAPAPGEEAMWWELSACLLSSQVPYELAAAAADRLQEKKILTWAELRPVETVAAEIREALSSPLSLAGGERAYRFVDTRAHQLARTWAAIRREAGSVQGLLETFDNPYDLRAWLVARAPGLGPKQASMLLRNIGWSYDLAILDRHVLNYMIAVGMDEGRTQPAGLPAYRKKENMLKRHANEMGYPVGLLDWAVWIVMRVASRPDQATAA